jgi:hypothetical protein
MQSGRVGIGVDFTDAPLAAERSAARLLESLLSGACLGVVVPATLEVVERDPLASGGCFHGDLVRGLMQVPGGFWSRRGDLFDRYQAVLRACASARRCLPCEQRMVFWDPLPTPPSERRPQTLADEPAEGRAPGA